MPHIAWVQAPLDLTQTSTLTLVAPPSGTNALPRILSYMHFPPPSVCVLNRIVAHLSHRYHIVSGAKIFYVLPPTKENLRKFEDWSCSPSQVGSQTYN